MSERGSLRPLIAPRSVAVIGASPDLSRYPGKVLNNLTRFAFPGTIYAVSPRHQEVMGLRCWPDISQIPEGADVALIILAAQNVPKALAQAIAAGCRSAVIFSAGMGEAGAEGRALQDEVRAIARKAGIRVLGPNCLGCVNVAASTVLSGAAGLQCEKLIAGPLGIAAQSGGIMGSMLDRAFSEGIGVSHAFSTGNEADVTLADCIDFMVEDDATKAICLFLEGVRDIDHFRAACDRAADRGKPIVALKIGRSEKSSQAALSHTGAIVGDHNAYAALFRRLGVIEVQDLDDLFHTANVLVSLPRPKGNRVAVACISGGLASLGADLCNDFGLPLADFQPETLAQIREMQAGFGDAHNPLDITGHVVSRENWWMVRRIQEIVLDDPNVDLLIFGQPASQYAEESSHDIIGLAGAAKKPVVPFWTGRVSIAGALRNLRDAHIPVFEEASACVRAVAAAIRAGAFERARAAAAEAPSRRIDKERKAKALALLAGRKSLAEHGGKTLLALYGIASPPEEVVTSARAAGEAAARIGFPVAVKAHSADLLHKSDRGGVQLNVRTDDAVAAAFAAVTQKTGAKDALVSRMIPPGPELILGLTRDPQVGLLMMVGMGGVLVEILRDVALVVPPLWPGEAQAMLAELHGAALLDGVRGAPPSDRAQVLAAIEGLSDLAFEIGDHIEQLDVNPLICTPEGAWAADALVIPRAG